MRNQGQIILAAFLILFGMFLLAGNLLNWDIGALFWPLLLIILGLLLVLRPLSLPAGHGTVFRFIGDVERLGNWPVKDEELWLFVGDAEYDFSQAEIPPGETTLRVIAFVSDVTVRAPEELSLSVTTTAFVTDSNIRGDKQDFFLSGLDYVSPGYDQAERKIRFEVTSFVASLKIR